MVIVVVRAVVFDIGGVLEITPDLAVDRRWETRLGLPAGEMARRMGDVWMGGGLGMITLDDVHQAIRDRRNSFVGAREREQAAYGFEDLVDEIVYSHEAGMGKPDPRSYALVCARLNVRPGEMVFLDDTDLCVAGAREAGIHAVHYRDNIQAIEEIEDLLTAP